MRRLGILLFFILLFVLPVIVDAQTFDPFADPRIDPFVQNYASEMRHTHTLSETFMHDSINDSLNDSINDSINDAFNVAMSNVIRNNINDYLYQKEYAQNFPLPKPLPEPRSKPLPEPPSKFRRTLTFAEALRGFGKRERDRIFADYRNQYQAQNLKNYGVALLGAGVMANTKIDRNFQDWYGQRVRCNFTQELKEFSKIFGEGKYFIPITITSAFTYRFLQEKYRYDSRIDKPYLFLELTDRSMRGYFVGFPALLAVQVATGGDRPESGTSYWHPFQNDHGASGHAFIGAIPFITAAQMTDRPCLKGLYYTLSTFPAWSRVNDDAHYLSQVLLGWYLAYLSARSVAAAEGTKLPRGLTIFPVTENNAVGIGLYYQR